MKNENVCGFGAVIERGIVTAAEDGLYVVRSFDRPGLVTPPLPPVEASYTGGAKVVFFLCEDRTGRILRGMDG